MLLSSQSPPPSIGELRSFLQQRNLPEYMVPSAFVVLDSLPLTPNGKIDRNALPALTTARPALETCVMPQTELEQTIAAIWREVLRLHQVGINDNFFDLGGHSLLMLKVHSRLRVTLGRNISLVELFRYPSISTLAVYLGHAREQHLLPDSADRAGKQRSALQSQQARLRTIAQQRATGRQ